MDIKRVGIVSGGLMGSGIAEVCARAGLEVVICEVDEGAVAAAQQRIERSLARAVRSKKIEEAGATILNTGIGWHEARIPTIAAAVPRAAFTWITAKLMGKVKIPLVASNRINTPEVAEQILARGEAD